MHYRIVERRWPNNGKPYYIVQQRIMGFWMTPSSPVLTGVSHSYTGESRICPQAFATEEFAREAIHVSTLAKTPERVVAEINTPHTGA